MEAEITAAAPATRVDISGINAAGLEGGNATICNGRVIPWLQDTYEKDVWGSWKVTWRDVVVLDAENRVLFVYNLTAHNLAYPAEYADLKARLLAAAQ
jgi:hypothetical protein